MILLLVPPLFIEGNSHSYNRSISVFAGTTVPYLVIFFDNGRHACVFLIGKFPGSQRCCKMCMVTSATYTVANIPPMIWRVELRKQTPIILADNVKVKLSSGSYEPFKNKQTFWINCGEDDIKFGTGRAGRTQC